MGDSPELSSAQPKLRRRLPGWLLGMSIFALVLGLLLCLRFVFWVKLINEAMDSIELGSLAKARKQAQQAIELMSFLPDNKSLAISLRLMEKLYHCRRQFDNAEVYANKVLEVDKNTYKDEYNAIYALDLSELALMNKKRKNFAKSEETYKKVITIYQSLQKHEDEVGRLKGLLAWVLFKQGRTKEALSMLDEADRLLQEQCGKDSFERILPIVERAFILKKLDAKQSELDIETAYRLATEPEPLSKSNGQVVVVLQVLAQLLEEEGDYDKALKIYEIAELNCKSCVFAAGYNSFMADILSPHASLLSQMGREKEAEPLRRQAELIKSAVL